MAHGKDNAVKIGSNQTESDNLVYAVSCLDLPFKLWLQLILCPGLTHVDPTLSDTTVC